MQQDRFLRTFFSGLVFFFAALLFAVVLDVRALLVALFVWLYAGLPLEAFIPAVRLASYAVPAAALLNLAWSLYRSGWRLRYAFLWRTFGPGDAVPQDLISIRGGTARFTAPAEVGMGWHGRPVVDVAAEQHAFTIDAGADAYVVMRGFHLRMCPGRTPPLTIPRTLQIMAFFALFIFAALL